MQNLNLNKKGFSLIELLTALSIIGIIATFAIPVYSDYRDNAYLAQTVQDMKDFMRAQEEFVSFKRQVAGGYWITGTCFGGTCGYYTGCQSVTSCENRLNLARNSHLPNPADGPKMFYVKRDENGTPIYDLPGGSWRAFTIRTSLPSGGFRYSFLVTAKHPYVTGKYVVSMNYGNDVSAYNTGNVLGDHTSSYNSIQIVEDGSGWYD